MIVLETSRLTLRPFAADDAAFILDLLNEPDWLRFIGDRKVRSLEDARGYLARGPLAHYARHGFGHYAVVRKADGAPLGMCGLLQRDTLEHPDLGFAFLGRFRGQGYARESAEAMLADGWTRCQLRAVVAITALDNERSIRLLERLGFRFERLVQATEGGVMSRLFVLAPPPG